MESTLLISRVMPYFAAVYHSIPPPLVDRMILCLRWFSSLDRSLFESVLCCAHRPTGCVDSVGIYIMKPTVEHRLAHMISAAYTT